MSKDGKLTGALGGGGGNDINAMWEATDAAPERRLLPRGVYVCHIGAGERMSAQKKGTPGYKLTFKVIEGEFKDCRVHHTLWLTPAALPLTKRDLQKLGITKSEQLDEPFPPGVRCNVRVVIKQNDDGDEFNEVREFEFVQVDKVEPDPFDTDTDPELPV